MSDGRKDNDQNLSHEDRVKGGEHSHDKSHDQNKEKNNQQSNERSSGSKSGHELTDEERSRGGKNS